MLNSSEVVAREFNLMLYQNFFKIQVMIAL